MSITLWEELLMLIWVLFLIINNNSGLKDQKDTVCQRLGWKWSQQVFRLNMVVVSDHNVSVGQKPECVCVVASGSDGHYCRKRQYDSISPGISVLLKTGLLKMHVLLRQALAVRPMVKVLVSWFILRWTSRIPRISDSAPGFTPSLGSMDMFSKAPGRKRKRVSSVFLKAISIFKMTNAPLWKATIISH